MAGLDEKRVAAASYILQFYQEVRNLTTYYVQYNNLLIEIESKTKSVAELPIEFSTQLTSMAQLLRQSVQVTYIQLTAIGAGIKGKKETKTDVEDSYVKIMSSLIFERTDIKKYVEEVNKFLIQGIMQTLLSTSEDLVSQITENVEENI